MFLSVLLIFVTVILGIGLFSFVENEAGFLVRVCGGYVLGSAFFSLMVFALSCFFGLSSASIIASLAILFLLVFVIKFLTTRVVFADFLTYFRATQFRVTDFIYYFSIAALLYFFFDRAMIEKDGAIFAGASQNLGDLPFHLGAIFSFTEGNNFPPENPSYAFAKFTYPFMADLVAACAVKFGAGARESMLIQNLALGFSLVVLLENFVRRLTGNSLAGKIAPLILLFNGGLGFILFFRDYLEDGRSFFEFIWNIQRDYTISDKMFRWGNSLITLFVTQRSLLFGMPITLIVFTKLWELFSREKTADGELASGKTNKLIAMFITGLLAGTLPLIHVHSLAVLFVVSAFLFFLRTRIWREWFAFGFGVCIIAIPELLWSLTGSATNLSKFIAWHPGWDSRDNNLLVFWFLNLGIFLPLLIIAIWIIYVRTSEATTVERNKLLAADRSKNLLLFYSPFLVCFIAPNLAKFAPWEWDNIKILIYWFVGSIPLVALLLAETFQKSISWKILAGACLIILTASGLVDIWRVVSRQVNYEVFNRDSVAISELIKSKTDPKALFLNTPTYNSPVVLSGRRSLMRYIGHLSSYGIDYEAREQDVKRLYEGTAIADTLLKSEGINYVLIGEQEMREQQVNENYFRKFPMVAETGGYRIYRVK